MLIKYRTWDEHKKEFFYCTIVAHAMPWTGWDDDNGKGIYLNDVIKVTDNCGSAYAVVNFDEKYKEFQCGWLGSQTDNFDALYELFHPLLGNDTYPPPKVVVIGNIHENPEYLQPKLLEVVEEIPKTIEHWLTERGVKEWRVCWEIDTENDRIDFQIKFNFKGTEISDTVPVHISTGRLVFPNEERIFEFGLY
jgi:hypothetical protein